MVGGAGGDVEIGISMRLNQDKDEKGSLQVTLRLPFVDRR